MQEVILVSFSGVLMLVGLAGVILPFLVGVPFAWLGLFIYAVGTGFENISLLAILMFLGLTVAVLVLDFLAPSLGAKKYQAGKWGILGAFLGLIIGIFATGFWGIIIGPIIGAFLGELISGKAGKQAFNSAIGAFVGFLAGTLIRLVLVLIIIGFFIISFF